MGSRGASSASGHSADKNIMTASLSNSALKQIESEMKQLEPKMSNLSQYAIPGQKSPGRTAKEKEYRNIQRRYQQLQGKRSDILSERAKTKQKSSNQIKKKHINGFGEATDRDIESLSYKNAQRRSEKEVNSWFGRGM